MKNPIFRKFELEDSCIVAAHLANERYLQRQAAQEEGAGQEQRTEPAPYEASDDDLPRIFFQSADALNSAGPAGDLTAEGAESSGA